MSKNPPNQHIPGNLKLSDQILVEAAREFGTPLYVYDAAMMEQRWRRLRSILPDNVAVYYSVKANPNLSIIDVFRRQGASFEIASSGELAAVFRVGVSPTNLIFVGPGKSKEELEEAVTSDLGVIAAESRREVENLQVLSRLYGRKTRVALRINPGRGKGTIAMGGTTQFGMEPKIALGALIDASNYTDLEIIGIHAYLGTGILNWEVVLEHTQMILRVADELQQKSSNEFRFIDVGGGLGIPYYDGDEEPGWDALRAPLANLIDEYLRKHPQTETLAVESGRFLVGPSGVFLARVLDVKLSGDKWFAILDGGTNVFGGDNRYRGFRPTPVRVLGNESTTAQPLTLCGPLCTSADQLAVDTLLPLPGIGDLVAFYQAGAYGLTASPGLFLSRGFTCEVLVHDGRRLSLIRERPTPEQFLMAQPHFHQAE